MTELYKVHRPVDYDSVIGQTSATQLLKAMDRDEEYPQAILFTGPSGCGKTTLARIVVERLNCGDADFVETDAASNRGIDMVRAIQKRIGLAPIDGDKRVWLIDECHALTSDAQSAFLKILEDTPSHVHFLLATTDPQKLKQTIRTRCTQVTVKSLSLTHLNDLITNVLEAEEVEMDEEVIDAICERAEGSARKALVLLNTVIGIEDPEEQLEIVNQKEVNDQAIEIARSLLKGSWADVSRILKNTDEDPESIRRMILAYMNAIVLKSPKQANRLVPMMEEFEEPFFDTGKPGLTMACYRALRE